jgi:uncharacterized membrane protein
MAFFSTRLLVLAQALRVVVTVQNGRDSYMLVQTTKNFKTPCNGADCSLHDHDDPAAGSFLEVNVKQQATCTLLGPNAYTEMKLVPEYAEVFGISPGNYQGYVDGSFHTFLESGLDLAGCAAKCASSTGTESTAAQNALDEQCAFFQYGDNKCWGFGCSSFDNKCNQEAAETGQCTSWVQYDGYKVYVMSKLVPTPPPTLPPTFPPPTPSPTPVPPVLKFPSSTMIQNNLGGLGPDSGPALMHIGSVATVLSSDVSMLVANITPYTPWKAQVNGMSGTNHDYVCFTQSCGQQVTFRFSLVDATTLSPVTLPRFRFTIADIDQGINGRCSESIILNGYESYVLAPATELTTEMTAAGLLVKSGARGTQADNPLSIYLSAKQKARAVQYIISGTDTFTLQYKTSPNGAGEEGYAGRRLCVSGTVPALR